MDVVEDKAELASLLEAEKSRRRLLEQRFSTAEAEADKLRYMLLITLPFAVSVLRWSGQQGVIAITQFAGCSGCCCDCCGYRCSKW